MNVLLFPFGSHGDYHPFIGLGLALRARGHAVTVAGNGHFRALIERVDLPFVEQGTAEEYQKATEHPDLWVPMRAFAHIFRTGIALAMRPQYELIEEFATRGSLVVVSNCMGFGTRIARDKLGVPLVTIHLQPSVMWSEHESPVLPGIASGPRWLKRFMYWIGERYFIDATVCPQTNQFRAELGLPPMRKTTKWWHSPDLVLGMFPDWFARPQPDWPNNIVLTRFPLWDEGAVTETQPELERFLQAGDPPIVFTPGSGNRQAREFFAAAVDACGRLKRRGLLLTRFREQVPAGLPDSMLHLDFVPFSRLLPRSAALVHHGGIGTTAQALRAGVPQLLMPLAHDQPDNAARIRRLGVGDWITPARFHGPTVAEALGRLLQSPQVKQACRDVAGRFDDCDPFAEACERIERLMFPSMRR